MAKVNRSLQEIKEEQAWMRNGILGLTQGLLSLLTFHGLAAPGEEDYGDQAWEGEMQVEQVVAPKPRLPVPMRARQAEDQEEGGVRKKVAVEQEALAARQRREMASAVAREAQALAEAAPEVQESKAKTAAILEEFRGILEANGIDPNSLTGGTAGRASGQAARGGGYQWQ
jgi:hypothetical protein